MFLLHIVSAYRDAVENFAASRARTALEEGAVPGVVHTPDPAAAHAILFFEHHPSHDPFFLAVLRHPLVRHFPGKCLLYQDNDFATPFLPGFFCSLTRRDHRPSLAESWVYLNQHMPNRAISHTPLSGAEPYLFSFIGAMRTHPVRRAIMRLPAARALLEDTSGLNSWEIPPAARTAYHERFARTMTNSLFVLCPRGVGPNSYRIYEAMQAGRVPVIISDDFAPPAPLPWTDFALFVPESEVASIPAHLAAAAPRAAALGRAARAAWERWGAWPAGFACLCAELPRFVRREAATTLPLRRAARLVCTSRSHAKLFLHSVRHRIRRSDCHT